MTPDQQEKTVVKKITGRFVRIAALAGITAGFVGIAVIVKVCWNERVQPDKTRAKTVTGSPKDQGGQVHWR